MSELKYEMKPVENKRERIFLKKSIYDPILDEFIKSGNNLVEVTVEGKRPNQVASALLKRIEKRGLEIEVSTAGGCIYLERKPSAT